MQEYVTEVRWTGRERLVQADKQGAEVLDVSERLLDREVRSFLWGLGIARAEQVLQPEVVPAVAAVHAHTLQSHEVLDTS